jgi:hypothetical protein
LPVAPAEDVEPNFSAEYTADEEVVDYLRMLRTQGAKPIVAQTMSLKTV